MKEKSRLVTEAMVETWHGVKLHQPDWSAQSHTIAFNVRFRRDAVAVHLILNAYSEALDFELPAVAGGDSWRRWIDTARDSPEDIVPWAAAAPVPGSVYRAEPHSVVVLYANAPSAPAVASLASGASHGRSGDGS